MPVSIVVRRCAKDAVPISFRRQLKKRLERVLLASGNESNHVCVSLSDDEELWQLNRTYAEEDHPTDVLSFAQPSPPAEISERILGDIVISVEMAQRQADDRGRPLMDEIFHLAVHGFCHLLGFDHPTPEEERLMFGYEATLRAQALGRGPVHACLPPRNDR